MKKSHYDVVIIGAGIHGAGVAQAAAARGYSVLVLEKNTIASGTSSRSSKLIHGGLRYLESFQFRLIYECLRERRILLSIAPNLVKLVPVYIPIYKTSKRCRLIIRIGLSLYSLLGRFRKETFYKQIPKNQWLALDGLEQSELLAVYQFYDAQTNDMALTKAVIASAQSMGAEIYEQSLFCEAQISANNSLVKFQHNGINVECRARVIVNAAGPWVARVLASISPKISAIAVELVQGTHIIINKPLMSGIFYVESVLDSRALFMIPWGNQTLVGTTEIEFQGDADSVTVLSQEIDYLLGNYNYYFARKKPVTRSSITASFAGIRVLPSNDASVNSRSRDTVLQVDDEKSPLILSIYGGKLTAYRHTAERVMCKIAVSLPSKTSTISTDTLLLAADEGD